MTLLLVEDNTGIAQALKQALAPLYRVDHVTGGDIALNKLASQSYDVLIIESVLHDMQGLKVCQQARKQGIDIPILMLGKEIKIADKIQYLDQGIDEYLMKPFSLGELKARLRVFARRSSLPTVRQGKAKR
jgi:DNA-binding response OmpR family regulator